MVVSAGWEIRFRKLSPDRLQRSFHELLTAVFAVGAAMTVWLHVLGAPGMRSANWAAGMSTALALIAILPFSVLIYFILRHNFLQIGRQKNLLYAVSATFLALLYLSLVRRVSGWLEPVLPPEASASILLFVLVIFIEPLQRILGRRLRETAQRELDRMLHLTAEIQQQARLGEMSRLVPFIASRVLEQFEFAGVQLLLRDPQTGKLENGGTQREFEEVFPIVQGDQAIGVLCVKPHGAMITGESRASLEFLCEQLPGALDLCHLIEEKLRLERQLAERERLALLGQMAASISHNLKNPLGSIKTILQLQLENPSLPESLRAETQIILNEVARLAAKLNQLLQFSRPALHGGTPPQASDVQTGLREVVGVLRHEAEQRGITLISSTAPPGCALGMSSADSAGPAVPSPLPLPRTQLSLKPIRVAITSEALNDIVSNLLLNALEATSSGGCVSVEAQAKDDFCVITVEDDGPGIPEALGPKIMQPFVTTKTKGTGLGLAIVARRVAEFGGRLEWESPIRNAHGALFRVILPQTAEMRTLNGQHSVTHRR
jgi:signal transduction histidine kinase